MTGCARSDISHGAGRWPSRVGSRHPLNRCDVVHPGASAAAASPWHHQVRAGGRGSRSCRPRWTWPPSLRRGDVAIRRSGTRSAAMAIAQPPLASAGLRAYEGGMTFLDDLKRLGLVAIIRATSTDAAVATAEALFRGGVLALEVTYSTPDCCGAIRRI